MQSRQTKTSYHINIRVCLLEKPLSFTLSWFIGGKEENFLFPAGCGAADTSWCFAARTALVPAGVQTFLLLSPGGWTDLTLSWPATFSTSACSFDSNAAWHNKDMALTDHKVLSGTGAELESAETADWWGRNLQQLVINVFIQGGEFYFRLKSLWFIQL